MAEQIGRRLVDHLSGQTTKAEFQSLVGGLLTDQDRKIFGKNATNLVAQAIIYPAVFPPYPATLDTAAYGDVVDDVMAAQILSPEEEKFPDTDRVARLLEISLEQGIVEMQQDGRLYVPKDVHKKIKSILLQYDDEESS